MTALKKFGAKRNFPQDLALTKLEHLQILDERESPDEKFKDDLYRFLTRTEAPFRLSLNFSFWNQKFLRKCASDKKSISHLELPEPQQESWDWKSYDHPFFRSEDVEGLISPVFKGLSFHKKWENLNFDVQTWFWEAKPRDLVLDCETNILAYARNVGIN